MNAGRPSRSEGCTEGLPEDATLEQDPSEQKVSPRDLGGQDGEAKARARLGDGKALGVSEEQKEEAVLFITICPIAVLCPNS